MDLRKLNHFVHVAEFGSFSKASGYLAIAQSALSRQIRELEEELGAPLLYRNGRGVVLTQVGEALLPRAKSLVDDAADLVRDIQSMHADPTGTVTLGVPPSISQVLLTPLLLRVRERFPNVLMRVMEGFSGHISEWLLDGRIDIAVLYGVRRNPAISTDELLTEDMHLVMREDDPLAARDAIPLAEVCRLPLVLPSRPHGLRLLIDHAVARQKLKLTVQVEVDSLLSLRDLVASGRMYTIQPPVSVSEDVAQGRLVTRLIVDPIVSRHLVLANSTQRPPSPASREITRLLRRQVQDLVAEGQWLGRLPH